MAEIIFVLVFLFSFFFLFFCQLPLLVYPSIGVFAIFWTHFQLPILIFHASSTSRTSSCFLASFPLFCLLPSRLVFLLLAFFPSSPPPGRSGLAASYLSVKALVPQMPKLLKSLFPVRDEKKELRPSPQNQQVSRWSSAIPWKPCIEFVTYL